MHQKNLSHVLQIGETTLSLEKDIGKDIYVEKMKSNPSSSFIPRRILKPFVRNKEGLRKIRNPIGMSHAEKG
jgi:hypothetical protein